LFEKRLIIEIEFVISKDPSLDFEKTSGKVRRIVGDQSRIVLVIRNLISNALKFTPVEGKISISVEFLKRDVEDQRISDDDAHMVCTTQINHDRTTHAGKTSKTFTLRGNEEVTYERGGTVMVKVTDTGVGLTPDQLSKIFGEGIQFNAGSLQKGQGSGLGLFISKGITQLHHGSLCASSKGMDRGATFTLTLPLFLVPQDVSSTDEESDSVVEVKTEKAKEDVPLSCLKILVVDDAAMNRKLLTRFITKKGYEADEAEDGQEALEKVQVLMKEGGRYDAILLDFEMPRMNGPEAARAMRKVHCDSFILGVTGNVLPDDVDYFKRCGANHILPKPFKFPDLEDLFVEYGITSK
jgi:CheY-like chemotaxis protein